LALFEVTAQQVGQRPQVGGEVVGFLGHFLTMRGWSFNLKGKVLHGVEGK
jgi:hypothetical protein